MRRHASPFWMALVPWLVWAVPALSVSDAVLLAAMEESLEADPALEGDAEVQERAISILGCTLHMTDINRTVRCIQGRIDREVERTRNTLNQQIQQLEGDLAKARADVQTEVEKAQRAMDQQIRGLRRDLQRAQADLQRTMDDLDRAQRDLQQQTGALFAGLDPATLSQLNLDPLVRCLAGTPADLGRLATDFAADPAKFAQAEINAMWTITTQHMDRLMGPQLQALARGSGGASVEAMVNEADRMMAALARQRPTSDCLWKAIEGDRAQARQVAIRIYPTVEDRVNQIMAEHVQPAVYSAVTQNLARVLAQAAGTPAPARRPTTAQRPSTPPSTIQAPSRLGTEHVQRQPLPLRTRGDDDEGAEHEWIEVDDGGAAVWARGVEEPALTERGILDLLPGKKDVAKIAKGVAAKHLLEERKIRGVADQVTQLAAALGDTPASQQALTGVESAISSSEIWTELVLLEIGMEILRFVGHKYIDNSMPWIGGSGIVEGGIGLVNTTEDAIGNVAVAACGLPPVLVSAAVCAAVRQMVELAYHNVAIPAAKFATVQILHVSWGSVVDSALKSMKEDHDPRQFREEAGALGALLDVFPTRQAVILLGEKEVKPIKEALYAYHESVRALSRAAVAQ